MKKIFLSLAATLLITSSAYAGQWGVGVAGSFFNIDADVTETTTAGTVGGGSANTNKGSVSHDGVLSGALFVQYTMDAYPVTVGFDYTPGSADISKKMQSRTETPTSGDNASSSTDFKANAEIENLMTAYVEIPVYNNVYLKGGYTQVDVNTNESGMNSYGNASSEEGITYGIGMSSGNDSGLGYKIAYEVIDFDTIEVKSSSSNKVSGDIDAAGVKVSVVCNF